MLGEAQVGSSSFPVAPYIKWGDADEVEPVFGAEPLEAVEEVVEEEIAIEQHYLPCNYEVLCILVI